MSHYLDAVKVLGRPPLTDCLEAGRRFARGDLSPRDQVGADLGDTTPRDEYAHSVEAEFQAMKALAEKARWPSDVAPRIVTLDAAWQRAKASANAKKASVFREAGWDIDGAERKRIREIAATIEGRLKEGPGINPKGPYEPRIEESFWTREVLGPIPGWGVVAGVGGALAVLGLALRSRSSR